MCLRSTPGALAQDNQALIVDADLRTVRSFPLAGTPSRARVSPSGRFAAWTVFVAGESYGAAFFSTRTAIVDTRTWQLEPDLEKFTVLMDGKKYSSADVNFWGVTFSKDDDTFYATLGTNNQTHLVKGSISGRSVTTLAQNVECPSLSPDETRVAYKKRVQRGLRCGANTSWTCGPCASSRSRRSTAWTTRPYGSTTAPSPTPCPPRAPSRARTCGPSPPTAAAARAYWPRVPPRRPASADRSGG